jgi:hypothetical protein
MVKIEESRSWWRPDVYQAFLRTVNRLAKAA